MMLNNGIYLLIMFVVCFRLAREKTIRPGTLWIVPALFVIMVLQITAQNGSVQLLHLALYAVSVVIGLAIGIWRGRMDKVRWNPDTRTVTSQSPISGIAIFVVIVLLRLAFVQLGGHDHRMILVGNVLLFISLGSVCGRRFLIYTRYKQLQVSH
ncbi:hypothetical protein ABE504_20410 [Paenibacillus oryzisoli]|uniref:hypothetical protein n=1 Tax=Paenibacillus oryzisoli TaxID=1850517 RepID=UPI003D2AF4B6